LQNYLTKKTRKIKKLLLITIVALLSFNNAQAQIFFEDFNAGIPATFTLSCKIKVYLSNIN